MEMGDFVKRAAGGDGVDEEESLAGAHVLLAHRAVFFLSCCIEDVEESNFVVDDTLFAIGV